MASGEASQRDTTTQVCHAVYVTDETPTLDSMTPPPPRPPARNPLVPGKQTITRDVYDALVDAFREFGDNFSAVAEKCKVARGTAKRAWERGWLEQKSKPWARPVSEVIKREQVLARAALERERDNLLNDHRIARQDSLRQAVEDSFADLLDSKKKQGRMIRAARDGSLVTLMISSKMLRAAVPLADKIAEQMLQEDLTVFERMKLLRQVGRFVSDSIEMAQTVEDMEHRALGGADTITEVRHTLSMTAQEARATLAEVVQICESGASADELLAEDGPVDVEWADVDVALSDEP